MIPRHGAPEAAFSGEGARLFGGRWNSPGRRVVYTSQHLSLAALETLAHADNRRFERDYVVFRIEIDERDVNELREDELPADWRARPVSKGARAAGDAWLATAPPAGNSRLVLSVPSVIVPFERNLLLNPAHPRFPELRIGPPTPFRFDERLRAPGAE